MKRLVTLRIGDLFCGAGGTLTGFLLALDEFERVRAKVVAVNHSKVAIETHAANHPDVLHLCNDAYKVKPLDAVPSGRLDVLMASPTCIFNSRARGGRPVSREQRFGRMTPTQVYRWCAELKPRRLLVENVPEFILWGPVCQKREACAEHRWDGPSPKDPKRDRCGQPIRTKDAYFPPIQAKAGVYFRAWWRRLERLGYRLQCRILNAADYGDATTRERFFLQGALEDAGDIRWPRPTHSKDGSADLFGATKRWRGAREVLDFSIRGESIFHRNEKDLLSKNTHKRLLAGAVRFAWPAAFVVALRELLRFQGVTDVEIARVETKARAAAARAGARRDDAFLVPQRSDTDPTRSEDDPLPTLTAVSRVGLAALVRSDNHGGNGLYVRSTEQPIFAATTNGGMALAEPVVIQANQGADRARNMRPASRPMQTIVTGDSLALAEPFVANRHGENGSARVHDVDEPLPTATCRGAGYVVEPFALAQGAGGEPRHVGAPLPTIPTRGAHSLVVGYNRTATARSVEAPFPTFTTRDRCALVAPLTHADDSLRARDVGQPFPTITTAARGELAFFAAAFGERRGQTPRTHSVDEPAPTIAASGRLNLVQAFVTELGIDITYRMVQPLELAGATSFPPTYVWPLNKKRTGIHKSRATRLIGNAVPVETARALSRVIVEELLHDR